MKLATHRNNFRLTPTGTAESFYSGRAKGVRNEDGTPHPNRCNDSASRVSHRLFAFSPKLTAMPAGQEGTDIGSCARCRPWRYHGDSTESLQGGKAMIIVQIVFTCLLFLTPNGDILCQCENEVPQTTISQPDRLTQSGLSLAPGYQAHPQSSSDYQCGPLL